MDNAVYISLAGPNHHSGLRPRDKTSYNHDIHPLLSAHAALSPTSYSTVIVKMGSFSETSDDKRDHVSIDSKQLDTGAHLDAGLHAELDPGEYLRIR